MNRSTLVTIIGIAALFVLQGFWLYRTYTLYIVEKNAAINDLFKIAIDKELAHRQFKCKDPKNPKFTFKSAREMTPEERSRLKGDTINYEELKQKGIANSFTEAVSQFQQEQLSKVKPLQIHTLDSLFREELQAHDLSFSACQIKYMDKDTLPIDSIGQNIRCRWNSLTSELRPIGLYSSHFLQATVRVAPAAIMLGLLYNLIASFGIAIFIIAALYYQLVVIARTRKELKERETAIHNAIHDLKSPLNGVFVLLDAVRGIVRGDALMEDFVRKGKGQIKRMTEMIESMQEATRRPEKGTPLKLEETDLTEMISYIREDMDAVFPDKSYSFSIDNELDTNRILTDKILLERCLRNLIENALKYSGNGVDIRVTLSRIGGRIRIAVKDTGWGIPRKAQGRIGSLFFRAKRADKPARPGYGIGLCGVSTLIRKLGGTLHFVSTEGEGSTFFLEFPGNIGANR